MLSRRVTQEPRDLLVSLVLAAAACILRPTNALIWVFLAIDLLRSLNLRNNIVVVINVLLVGVLAVTTSIIIDSTVYGKITFPAMNFIKFNLIDNIASFYGTHPWYWYLSNALPYILLTYCPQLLLIVRKSLSESDDTAQKNKTLIYVCAGTIIVYSLSPHKEFRFLMPIVPLLLILISQSFSLVSSSKIRRLVLFVAITQAIPAIYFTHIHQRGVIDVMDYLRRDVNVKSVGFLMPCHSTPFHERLRKPRVVMQFLTCEPPIEHVLFFSPGIIEL